MKKKEEGGDYHEQDNKWNNHYPEPRAEEQERAQ